MRHVALPLVVWPARILSLRAAASTNMNFGKGKNMQFRLAPAWRLRSLSRLVAMGLVAAVALQALEVRAQAAPPPPPADTTAAVDPGLFKALKWRGIGPYRGGRALAVSGVPGDPDTFYFGAVAGGVWKTTDGGATWRSLTDGTPISSVGA
ncbi:MAG: hypothetical protein WA747_01335, partial [Steroidobacteraceae bacterium]